jgi:hypothetical protein
MTKQTMYGVGYVRLIDEDGSELRVTVEQKDKPSGIYKPFAIKDVSKLAAALR